MIRDEYLLSVVGPAEMDGNNGAIDRPEAGARTRVLARHMTATASPPNTSTMAAPTTMPRANAPCQ